MTALRIHAPTVKVELAQHQEQPMLMHTLSILPVRISPQQSFTITIKYAGVAELADAPDLGSGGTPVQVQVLSPAPD